MPTSFSQVRNKLIMRLNTLEKAFERHVIAPSVTKNIDKYALQEGLISSLWQAWGEFCREVVIGAVKGANTTVGTLVSSPTYSARTELEIAFVAKRLASAQSVGTIRSVAGRHQEPTWGDVTKLVLIVSGLAPSNVATMLTAFGSATAIKDLQTYRNASAHICSDTLAMVTATRVRYRDTHFRHPSDTMKWTDPATNDYLWRTWIDEIDLVSDIATQ